MKKHIIVVNDKNYSESAVLPAITVMRLMANATDANFNLSVCAEPGWTGSELKKIPDSVTDVFLVPIGFIQFELLANMQALAHERGHGVVASHIISPSNFPNDFYSLDSDYIAYVDLAKLPDRRLIDFGSSCLFTDSIHIREVAESADQLLPGEYHQLSNIQFKDGWILLKCFLDSQQTVGRFNYSPAAAITNFEHPDWQRCLLTRTYDPEVIGLSQEDFFKACEAITSSSIDGLNLQFSSTVSTAFDNSTTPLENFYCPAQVELFDLLKSYMLTGDTRLIFYSNSDEQLNKIRSIIETWDGVNTNEIPGLSSSDQAFLSQWPASFEYTSAFRMLWNRVQSIYKAWFKTDAIDLIEDLKSQRHVNNTVVINSGTNGLILNGLHQVSLPATEFLYIDSSGQTALVPVPQHAYQHRKYKKFVLTFRNTQTGATLPLEYRIRDFFTAQKWARCLHYDYFLDKNNIAEKNYMLQQWEYDESNPNARSIPVLCQEMNRYVQVINNYFDGSSDRRLKYEITQYFDPATLDQQILNEIHHHFELLIGQVWSVSDYYKLADPPTTFAIRQLNNLCHEMEYLRRPSLKTITNPRAEWHAGIYFPFIPTHRYKFVECDYDHFTQITQFGDLVLHYAQLGKTPLEAYAGRDEEVFDDNITGLRYLSGEFDIIFRRDVPLHLIKSGIAKYNVEAFKWIRARGQDPESKFTGIGCVPVAKLDRSRWPGMTANEIMIELFNYDDVYCLELFDENDQLVESKVLDYTWRDVLKNSDPTHPEYTGLIAWHWD